MLDHHLRRCANIETIMTQYMWAYFGLSSVCWDTITNPARYQALFVHYPTQCWPSVVDGSRWLFRPHQMIARGILTKLFNIFRDTVFDTVKSVDLTR